MFLSAITLLPLSKDWLGTLKGNEGGWDGSAIKSTSYSCRKDLSSSPSTQSRYLSTACNSRAPGYVSMFWPLHASVFLCTGTHRSREIKINKPLKVETLSVLKYLHFRLFRNIQATEDNGLTFYILACHFYISDVSKDCS